MKKIIITLLTLLAAATVAFAVPALRGKYKYTQPDGTVIMLENHGDEYYHWTTDAQGNTVEKDADGYFRVVPLSQAAQRAQHAQARAQGRFRAAWSSFANPPVTNFGDRKVLCILAEFKATSEFDGKFVVENPKQHFTNMLNQVGYSENGAIGSVGDYYRQNSGNKYRPVFDVYGPVTLNYSSSHYDKDANGNYHVSEAIQEAYSKLSSEININDYDTDNNGTVDMILFYYPGYNEAEHGPTWTIWPHQSTGTFGWLGGKIFNRYFCTSELRGNSGAEPASIGTTCHEFAHSLGLPDFYDVGDEKNGGENTIYETVYSYDLMCYGNYNDNGRRPPYLTSLERNMLGWMEMPATLEGSGDQELEGVQNDQAFRIDTQTSGEFFLLECRNGAGWDSGTPENGLLVLHVDQSSRNLGGGVTPYYLWQNTNNINSYGGHPCYCIVPSWKDNNNVENRSYVFPGLHSVPALEPTDWDGTSAGVALSNISFDGSKVTFRCGLTGGRLLYGYVKNVNGEPLQDATVVLSRSSYVFRAPGRLSTDRTCQTDANGYYSFTLDDEDSQYQVVKAMKDDYVSLAENVLVTGRLTQADFILMHQGEVPPGDLAKYVETEEMTVGSLGSGDFAVGMRYSAAELAEMGALGATISTVYFAAYAEENNGQKKYVVIDIGGERVLCKDVTDIYQKAILVGVDISDEHIVIPAGKDVYIGYGLTDVSSGTYPFLMSGPWENNHGSNYILEDFLTSSGWSGVTFDGGYYDFIVSADLFRPSDIDFASYGVSYIKLVNGVPQVVPAAGKTVYSVTWYVDGTVVEGTLPAVSELSSGAHTYKAVLAHYDGTSERVYYDVTKE